MTGIPNVIRRQYEGRTVYEGRWKENGKTRYTSRYNCPLKAEKALLARMSPERRQVRDRK